MLPRVKIVFENGNIGSVAPSADGATGLVVAGASETGTFEFATAYCLRKLDGLADLGITNDAASDNAFIYKIVKQFYDEAGDGAELWLMGFPDTEKQSDLVNKSQDTARLLIQAAAGRLKTLITAINPDLNDTPSIQNGLDADLVPAMLNAQALAEWVTDAMFAPLIVILEARHYGGDAVALADLSQRSCNRVGVLLGDTVANSTGSAVGLLAGRIARIPVQRHIGRVRDLAVKATEVFIGDKPVEQADVEMINDKGFITFRTFTGKAGYFFADDNLATKVADDYRSIARRRTIDKAYRIAYATLIEFLNDELPLTDAGELSAGLAASWEMEVETAIISQMGADGNLGSDPASPQDTGVRCFIDRQQKPAATGRLEVSLKIKPYGYAKYIDVKLGFMTQNN